MEGMDEVTPGARPEGVTKHMGHDPAWETTGAKALRLPEAPCPLTQPFMEHFCSTCEAEPCRG